MSSAHPRKVRSFVKRAGRTTASQTRALSELWPVYGVPPDEAPLDYPSLFGREAPVVLEIGFGDGETLVETAAACPERDFIGIEVHEPGIGHCLLRAAEKGTDNLRIVNQDAVEVMENRLPDHGLAQINLYFPDPWPKKRHHKRRIVQPRFLSLCARKLAPGGQLCIATDWENYAEHIDEAIAACPVFALAERVQHRGDKPLDRLTTKFERRGLGKGHGIWDWRLVRDDAPD